MKESSTLKYIAKELGVSVSTVSRALNGKTVVKEATRQRVLEAAKKYNYMPNEVANWGNHYQLVATKSVVARAISKEILTKRGLISISDYYQKVAHI